MTPERWARVKELFHSALDREATLRHAFVAKACSDDEVRREVEALLEQHEQANSFMEQPALRSGEGVAAGHGTLSPGRRLGPYEVRELIGAGGMGEVYRARDTRLDRDVAIKVLPEAMARDPAALARFIREAKAVAALSHPNILAIYDVGVEDGVSFAVMELLQGETLRERIGAGRLPWREAVEIAGAVAQGLAAAHARGIVHRDLKPDNLFLIAHGQVKILDFGLATEPPRVGEASGSTVQMLTRPGLIMGTPGTMSPEQVRGETADARSDLFSLGCVLYEMVTGQAPFTRRTPTETVAAVLKDEPPPIRVPLPPALVSTMRRCLEKEPARRFASAGELAAALRASEARPAPLSVTRRAAALAAIGLVVVAAVTTIWWRATRGTGAPVTLVVLPFDNLTGDPDQDYLGDGLTEELINQLGRLQPRRLHVIARASAMACKTARKSPAQMASELHVDYILEGSVRRAGERLRVSAQLMQARDQTQIWAEDYDRALADTLAMEDEVAQAVAGSVRPVIAPSAAPSASRGAPPSAAVREACLRGRYHWNKRTKEGFGKAREHFEEAIRLDPRYAPAYSGLADVYLSLYDYELMPPAEADARASEAAQAALARDPLLAEAHSSLAHVDLHAWDWAGSEKEFRRALELDPSYVTAHHWYALCLTTLGRVDEAVAQMRIARGLDPLSLRINADLGMALHAARRYDEAIEQERRTMELDANYPTPYFIRGMAYEQKGQLPEAIGDYEEAVRRTHRSPNNVASLGHAYALAGRKAEARQIADELAPRAASGSISPFYLVLVYVGLGEKATALDWLEKAYQAHSGSVRYLKVDRRLEPLRSEPRYQDLMRRVGLAP